MTKDKKNRPDNEHPSTEALEAMLGPVFKMLQKATSESGKKIDSSREETKKKVKRAIERKEKPSKTIILDGDGAKNLKESIQAFEMPYARVVAGTDAGANYKPKNEDRAGINTDANFAVVADGMGKYGKGADAAQFLVKALVAKPTEVPAAVSDAQKSMRVLPPKDGAAFISAQITSNKHGRKFLTVYQAGDARVFIVDAKGKVRFCSKDQGLTQIAVDYGHITADQALYDDMRHMVDNPIRSQDGKPITYEPVPLRKRDRVYLCSDGISDNLTPEEIAVIAKGKTVEETMAALSDITDQRMQNYSDISHEAVNGERAEKGRFSDGYLSKPKPDNRALIIMEIL